MADNRLHVKLFNIGKSPSHQHATWWWWVGSTGAATGDRAGNVNISTVPEYGRLSSG
ncbi:MAG: hypothetical protein H7210_03235 [Pyrinomonadaceae bacterium]|nr:hypothetical protein [Phycisphaerales bacterium]